MAFASLWMLNHQVWYKILARCLNTRQRPFDGAFLSSLLLNGDINEIVERGKSRLRRVSASNTIAFISGPVRSGEELLQLQAELTEPCEFGSIDFFVSHSWRDEA